MNLSRAFELGRAMVLGFVREPTALFFTLAFPLMFLFVFGGIFGDEQGVGRYHILVAGDGPVVDALPAEVFDVTPVATLEEGLEQVGEGDAVAVVAQSGDEVTVRYQASDQVGGQVVVGVVSSVVQQANLEALGGQETFALEARQVEDESLSGIEFMTPGLLSWAVAVGAVFGSSLTLVTWRTNGLLRRLRLTPTPVADIVVARVVVSLAVAALQTALFLAVGVGVFGLDLAGQWWVAFPLVLVGTLAFLSIGMLVGAVVRTTEAASAVANLVIMPMAFLSGAFFPLDDAPGWLRAVSQLLPLTHLLEALTDVMVLGRSPATALPHVAVLLGFAAVFVVIASRSFRWDRI